MSYTKQVFPHLVHRCYATKRGYWDMHQYLPVQGADAQFSLTMKPYNGMSLSLSPTANAVEFTAGPAILPNYQLCSGQTGVLAPNGVSFLVPDGQGHLAFRNDGSLLNCVDSASATTYYCYLRNNQVLLSLTDSVNDGIHCGQVTVPAHTVIPLYAAQFTLSSGATLNGSALNAVSLSSGGVLTSSYTFPVQATNPFDVDIILHVTTGASVSSRQMLLKIGSYWFGINNSKFALSNGVSVAEGQAISASTSYWLRIVQSGEMARTYILYYLVDDGTYTLNTLPNFTQWAIGKNAFFMDAAADNNHFIISDATYPWGGTFSLSDSRVSLFYSDAVDWTTVSSLVEEID